MFCLAYLACPPRVLQELCVLPSEMQPEWFAHDDIPYKTMWPDDTLWYPKMLNKKYFDAYMKFKGHDIILDYTITDRASTDA